LICPDLPINSPNLVIKIDGKDMKLPINLWPFSPPLLPGYFEINPSQKGTNHNLLKIGHKNGNEH
jgi:hypothetical protein